MRRGDAAAAIARRAAPARGPHRDRRPGPLLPRGPGRAGRPGRGRRHASSSPRPSTPPRSSTWSATVLGLRRQRRHGRGAPHGRRLRRQGDPGRPVRRDRGAGRAQDRPPRQGAGLDRDDDMVDDRQAPRLRHRLRGRLRRRRPHPGRRLRPGRPLRLLGRPLRRHRPTGRCSTPTTPTSARTSRIALAPLQDQHGLQHRLPRLRRPAGHDGDRAR